MGPTTPPTQRLPLTRKRFGLLRFRSPLLPESAGGSPRLEWTKRQAYVLAYLTWYTLLQQYSKATLGLLWFLVSPILLLGVYGFVLTGIYRVEIEGLSTIGYSLLILCGLMPWMAFSDGVSSGSNSIINFPAVVRNSPLPAIFLPTVKVLQTFLGLAFAYGSTLVVAGVSGNLELTRLPVILLAYVTMLMFTLGVTWFLSALCVYVRDVTQLISTVMLIGLFVSPVLYTPDMAQGLPHYVHVLIAWNPITSFLGLMRAPLSAAPLLTRDLVLAPTLAVVTLCLGFWCFRKLEPGMADSL